MSEYYLNLKDAKQILIEYREPNSFIDRRTLFFAATEYQKAYDALHASLSHLKQCAQAMVDAHPCPIQGDCHCPTCEMNHALAAMGG